MAAPERRDPPPPLEFAFPDCPICEQETGCDPDGFLVCENCDVQWSKEAYDRGERGEWFNETENATQCGAERWVMPYGSHPEPWCADRCVLEAGHGGVGGHLNGDGYRFDARTRDELLTNQS